MNTNYQYYNEYYKDLGNSNHKSNVEKINKNLVSKAFEPSDQLIDEANHSFILKTIYPGLLLGTGYHHGSMSDSSGSEEEIKVGFHLDYVTGLPHIVGSTVKGALRSIFLNYTELVKDLFGDDFSLDEIEEIELKLFGKNHPEYNKKTIDGSKGIAVFYDAVPLKGNEENKIFGFEYITPHKDPIKNPIPIKLLKVMPDVKYLFRFKLEDILLKNGKMVNTDKILAIFSELIELFGIGAKTNVGFGNFETVEKSDFEGGFYWLEEKSLLESNEYGVVKWFNADKGFGFITSKNKGDIFVHYSEIDGKLKTLHEGDKVEFQIGKSAKGLVAKKVEVI